MPADVASRSLRAAASVAALPLLLAATTARADGPSTPDEPLAPPEVGAVHLGASLGAHANLGSWDLYRIPDQGVALGPGGLLVVRGGVQLARWLVLEADLGLLNVAGTLPNPTRDVDGLALHGSVGALLTPLAGAWEPYLSAGLGAFHTVSGSVGADTDWDFHGGLGVRGALTEALGLRAEARLLLTDPQGAGLAPVLLLTAGLDLRVAGPEGPPRDRDGDGVIDRLDACPDEDGVRSASLLKDGLGVGCPDVDRDGLVDRDDRCMMEPGPQRLKGCADRDGDGVADIDDACREKPGLAEHEGCPPPLPDEDADGVTDDVDGCPEEKGSTLTEGCPDADGDAVADLFDRCASEVGVASEGGCLPKGLARKFRGVVKGFDFDAGAETLKPAAARALDELAKLLLPHDALRLVVTVEVAPSGDASADSVLAQARADAIRQGLADRGVPTARVLIEVSASGKREQVSLSYRGPPAP
jgi:outer membrane protein OmpA-like peptidoglycan-associated protein